MASTVPTDVPGGASSGTMKVYRDLWNTAGAWALCRTLMVTSAGLADVTPSPSCAVTKSFTLAAPRSARGEVRVSVPAGGEEEEGLNTSDSKP